MKRLSCILLAAMLVAALAVSCTAEVIDDMNLVSVGFEGVRDDGSKGLTVAQATLDVYDSSISWTYKAYKNADDKTPATGTQTEDKVQLPGGISSGKLTLSQGVWNFELYGYVDKVLVYQGKAMEQPINGTKTTVQIKVSPLKTEEGKGTLVFRNGIVIVDGNGKSFAANSAEYAAVDAETSTSVDLNSNQDTKVEDLKSGAYTVTVYCKDAGFVYAQASAVVTIYDGLESFISGTLDENTAEAGFGVIKVDAAAGTTSQSQSISDSAEAEYIYGFSPASEGLSDTKTTTIKGSFAKTDETKASSLELKVYDRSSSAQRFTLSNGGAVIAGFDFTLDNATIENGTKVEVSTYIGTGYTKDDLKVVYKENPVEVFTIVDYNSTTGVLVFETNHFSEYYVTIEDACVLNVSSNKKYIDLQDAIDNANDGDTIKLSVNVGLEKTVIVDKELVLDLDGKTISNTSDLWNESTGDWSLISVRKSGNLTIKGEGCFTVNDTINGRKIDLFSLDVQSGGEITICSGTFTGIDSAVYGYEGFVYVKGGTFSAIGKDSEGQYVLNCYNEMYGNKKTNIIVTGGVFKDFNPAQCCDYPKTIYDTNFVAEGYEVVEESGVYTVRPKVVSVWDGTVFTWESVFSDDSEKGFLLKKTISDPKKGQIEVISYGDSAKNSTCVANAKKFIEWFDSNLVDTGKIKLVVDGERKTSSNYRIAEVTISSADAFASIELLQKYFAAKCIVIASETSRPDEPCNDYYYWANAAYAAEISVDIDMDLNGSKQNWNPVNCPYPVDFKDHTVSNLNCVHPNDDNVGLFKSTGVSNLVLENAVVEGNRFVGAVAGGCSTYLKNVIVRKSTVKGLKYVGGLTGQAYANISDSTVEGSTISGADDSYQIGGIVGFQCQGTVSGCTVSKCEITAAKEIGGIAGRAYIQSEKDIVIEGNTVSGTTVATLEGTKASSFIGSNDNYAGFVCGGNYLSPNDGKTYKGNPSSYHDSECDYRNASCMISNNTVDGTTH